jgi:hypothetical protein
MSLISSYLLTTKNLAPFLNSLTTAQAPEVFTQKFLESLEFKSTNDRLFIGLLKGLGFLDESGKPVDRYYKFLDQTQSKKVLADAIREAYGDLFAVQIKVNELTATEVKNKLRTLTLGKNSDRVLGFMANTFKALTEYAEWDNLESKKDEKDKIKNTEEKQENTEKETLDEIFDNELDSGNLSKMVNPQLHYNIQIHLPESRNQAVYDVLFKSLKKHLF